MASLVSERCLLNWYLSDQPSIPLSLDSGFQVSIINIEEFAKKFSDVLMADDKDISFEGWLDMRVKIG